MLCSELPTTVYAIIITSAVVGKIWDDITQNYKKNSKKGLQYFIHSFCQYVHGRVKRDERVRF